MVGDLGFGCDVGCVVILKVPKVSGTAPVFGCAYLWIPIVSVLQAASLCRGGVRLMGYYVSFLVAFLVARACRSFSFRSVFDV